MVVIIPRPDDPGAVQENVVIIYTESAAGNCMTAAVRRIPEDLNR